MKKQTMIFLLWLVSLNIFSYAESYPLKQLNLFADGLNIEGGRIPRHYLNERQIWANLCVILDRPFDDGVEWQELTSQNVFPLKEASLLSYNEAQVNSAYALILHYYLTHAHKLAKKVETVKILIQVHRNTSGPVHLRLLEELLFSCYPELKGEKSLETDSKYELFSYFFPDLNVKADFCFGTWPHFLGELGKYENVDIVLSFSLVAGLHSEWTSGALLIPDGFIPFPLRESILDPRQAYSIKNHLLEALQEILITQEERVFSTVNAFFLSPNPHKKVLKAKKLTLEDFKRASLLEVDGMFNPSQLPSNFHCLSIKQ